MRRISRWGRLVILGSLALLLSWLVGCSQSTAPKQQIEFWTMQLQPEFTSYFDHLIAEFERAHPPAKVHWVDVPWTAMESKILTAVSAGTAPDVVNLNPDFALRLAGEHAWLNLETQVTKAQQALYLPKIWQASTLDGHTFGLPWYLTSRVTIYNRQILKQASLEHPPATYAELAGVARQIKQRTGKYAFFITFVTDDSAEVLESLVQMGVQLLDPQGKAAFTTPQGKAAFQYWVDLYRQGLLPPEVLTQGHRQAVEMYQSGQTALLASGPEFLTSIATNAPTIARVSGVAPQISGPGDKVNVAVMNLVIPAQTQQVQTALDFALFVTNNPNQLSFAQAANVLPSTREALKQYTAALAGIKNPTPLQQARVVSAEQLPQAEPLLPVRQDLLVLQRAIYENLQAAMLGQKTVDQALTDAAQAWDNRDNS